MKKKDVLLAFIFAMVLVLLSFDEKVPTETTEPTETVIQWKEEVSVEPLDTYEVAQAVPRYISLGTFRLTAYCPCEICCGQWSGGATASGVMPRANHTIAVDTDVIPFGTEVVINGKTYVAEDTGSGINENCIDIFFDSHQQALEFGVKYAEVFIERGTENGN